MSREVIFSLNVADKPVGYAFGGKNGTSVACPRCSRPGLLVRTYRKGGLDFTEYAHLLEYALNSKNDPELVPGDLCLVAPAPKKTPDGSPTIAKRSVAKGAP